MSTENGTVEHSREHNQLLRGAWAMARHLPERAHQGMQQRPELTLAVVAGVAFAIGTMTGSRAVRALLYAAIPYAVGNLLVGAAGESLRKQVIGLARGMESPPVAH